MAYALRKQVLTNLITGPANEQQTVRRSDLALLSWLLTIRKLASQKSASGKLHSLVQIVGDTAEGHRGWELCRIARDPGAILADLNVPLMSQVSMCHTNAVIRRKRGDSRVEIGEPRGEIAAAPSYLCA